MNVFCKLKQVKSLVDKEFGNLPDVVFMQMAQKLANQWHYKKRKKGIVLSKEIWIEFNNPGDFVEFTPNYVWRPFDELDCENPANFRQF